MKNQKDKKDKSLWIARDVDGSLNLFRGKPFLLDTGIWWGESQTMFLQKDDIPEVTFENSPQQVVLKLKEGNGEVGI